MNPDPGSVVAPADQPPDMAAARRLMRDVRRRLATSHGAARALMGLAGFVGLAVTRAVTQYKTEANMQAFLILAAHLVVLQVLLPPIITRLRQRRGMVLVSRTEAGMVRVLSRTGVIVTVLAAGVIASLGGVAAIVGTEQLGIPYPTVHRVDTILILAATGLLALLYLARYAYLRLWEDLLMVAGILAMGVPMALARDYLRVEVMVMFFAIAATASGLALHFRWREWVRQQAAQGEEAQS